ncbi:hypothetical protein BDV93DRAFT_526688 [Ceratobasidium sp. AG-I]|nr:hypothetical protein BDV93DRAFT_526688 [Ceratobasidium sp. AG-I]
MASLNSKKEVTAAGDPKPHPKFYFDNTLIVIRIEDTLFNVHKYQLMKSETFSDMFKIGDESGQEDVEGSSPKNPIVMSGVAASDFEALLTVLYATRFSTYQPDPEASLIIPAFRLANMWNFAELRAYLVPLAEKVLDDIDKIIFAREFEVRDWLAPAHIRLCQRQEPLTSDEASKLGVDSLLLIHRIKVGNLNALVTSVQCPSHPTSEQQRYCTSCRTNYGVPAWTTTNGAVEQSVKAWVDNGCRFAT